MEVTWKWLAWMIRLTASHANVFPEAAWDHLPVILTCYTEAMAISEQYITALAPVRPTAALAHDQNSVFIFVCRFRLDVLSIFGTLAMYPTHVAQCPSAAASVEELLSSPAVADAALQVLAAVCGVLRDGYSQQKEHMQRKKQKKQQQKGTKQQQRKQQQTAQQGSLQGSSNGGCERQVGASSSSSSSIRVPEAAAVPMRFDQLEMPAVHELVRTVAGGPRAVRALVGMLKQFVRDKSPNPSYAHTVQGTLLLPEYMVPANVLGNILRYALGGFSFWLRPGYVHDLVVPPVRLSLSSYEAVSAGVLQLMLDYVALLGIQGAVEEVLQGLVTLGFAIIASDSSAGRKQFLESRGQLLVNVLHLSLRHMAATKQKMTASGREVSRDVLGVYKLVATIFRALSTEAGDTLDGES